MLEVLLSILILAVLTVGAYFAALKYVDLRHNRDIIADELKRATEHIAELESRVMMLEAERDTDMARMEHRGQAPQGFGVFDMRN